MDYWDRQTKVTKLLIPVVKPWTKLKFNYKYDPISDVKPPYLLVCNHNTDFDPIFVNISANVPLRFVASEHIMRKGLGTTLIQYFFNTITIKKGSIGLSTTADMLRSLKNGQSVMVFPEGNRSFNGTTGFIPQVTGKLAKKSGASLVTYNLKGGYLTQPRWGTSIRKGELIGTLVNVYTPEELKKMKADEVTEHIRKDLYVDAYADQDRKLIRYKGKRPAYSIESAIFCCPKCRKFNSLTSDKRFVSCNCGFKAEYDDYGYLNDLEGNKLTLTELDFIQREELKKAWENADIKPLLFSDYVTAQEIGDDHQVIHELKGSIEAFSDGFCFRGTNLNTDDIKGVAVHSRNTLTVHYKNDFHYEIKGEACWNALKYVYLFNLIHGKEMF